VLFGNVVLEPVLSPPRVAHRYYQRKGAKMMDKFKKVAGMADDYAELKLTVNFGQEATNELGQMDGAPGVQRGSICAQPTVIAVGGGCATVSR
jgi:hypothetical protein